jgi:hypothetical protein
MGTWVRDGEGERGDMDKLRSWSRNHLYQPVDGERAGGRTGAAVEVMELKRREKGGIQAPQGGACLTERER